MDSHPAAASVDHQAAASERTDYEQATAHLRTGDPQTARTMLIALAERGSRHWKVYHDLGALALAEEDLESASALFSHAVSLAPQPGSAHIHLALVQSLQTEFETALATLSPVLRNNPEDRDALALVRKILGATAELDPIPWARLLTDLRTMSAPQRTLLDEATANQEKARQLLAQNEQLRNQVAILREELLTQQRNTSGHATAWETVHALSDEEWLQVLIRSIELPSYQGFPLPAFPDESVQLDTVGSSNASALREGFNFFHAVKSLCAKHGRPLNPTMRLLDFGTGWGRYARLFLKEIPPEHILGVDVDPSFVDICRNSFPYARFETVPAFPPSGLAESSQDLIIAYSVFSHLSEAAASAWIEEFIRLLAPGGLIAITTQGRSFIEFCESIRVREQLDTPWHRNLARSFIDRADCERRYDAGEFLHSATGTNEIRPATFYGESLIPRQYVERHWTNKLKLLEFIDDRGFLPQALILLHKPA